MLGKRGKLNLQDLDLQQLDSSNLTTGNLQVPNLEFNVASGLEIALPVTKRSSMCWKQIKQNTFEKKGEIKDK